MSAPVANIREFEKLLRDKGGFSRAQAKQIALHGWSAIVPETVSEDEQQRELQELLALVRDSGGGGSKP